MSEQDINPCGVCSQSSAAGFRLFFNGYGGRVKLWRCLSCGYVAWNIGPGRWRPVDQPAGTGVADFLAGRERWMYPRRRRVLADIRDRIIRAAGPTGRLLDVGCGDGQFLALCGEAGYTPVGIEPDEALAAHAAEAADAEVRAGLYETGLFPAGTFDVITFIQTLEHIPAPAEALAAAITHLRPGGLVVIEVPSIHSPHWLAWRAVGCDRLLENRWGVFAEHVGYYSPRSLGKLTRRAGFEQISMVTGRWRVKYTGPLAAVGRLADPLLNYLRVGGILYMGKKPPHGDS